MEYMIVNHTKREHYTELQTQNWLTAEEAARSDGLLDSELNAAGLSHEI